MLAASPLKPNSRCLTKSVETHRLLTYILDRCKNLSSPIWSLSTLNLAKSLATHSSSDRDNPTDEEDYTAQITHLCAAGNLSIAATFLQSLQDKNIFLPDATTILMKAAGEKNDFNLSLQIFKQLLFSGKPLTSKCYLNLARAFAQTDDCNHLRLFVKQVSQLDFPRSIIVLNRIILAFSECRQIEKVTMIFNQMKSSDCKPDLITYNTVLDILGRSGRMIEMLEIFGSMKEASMVPDIISYNTLLNSLRKAGRLDICLVLLREMGENGTEPDLLTYTSMIDSFGRSGNTEESLRLFSEMKQKKILPSVYIYRSLIDSLKKAGKVEQATKLMEEINSSKTELARPEHFKRKGKTVTR